MNKKKEEDLYNFDNSIVLSNDDYMDQEDLPEMKETVYENKSLGNNGLPKIKLFGVGGGGCNMVNYITTLSNDIINKIELIGLNTDIQALNNVNIRIEDKIQLGKILTNGMGAGMRPEIGEEAAIESEVEIKRALADTEILFLSGGLGGGTGTGALPQIAKIAKEMNILTIAVVTKPFAWEGKKRMEYANESLSKIENIVDSLIVIPNDKLLEHKVNNEENISIKNAFQMVNNVLSDAVFSITALIMDNSVDNINVDFADVETIMSHKGKALMTIGKGETCEDAIENGIKSPLLENFNIDGSKGILINFKTNPNISLIEINKGMEIISSKVDENAEIIFGTITDDNLNENEVEVTIIATGFDSKNINKSEVVQKEIDKLKSTNNDIKSTSSTTSSEVLKINDKFINNKDIPAFMRK